MSKKHVEMKDFLLLIPFKDMVEAQESVINAVMTFLVAWPISRPPNVERYTICRTEKGININRDWETSADL